MNGQLEELRLIGRLEALRTVADSQRHRIVSLLIDAPMTAAELAQKIGSARTRMYYHLNLLEQHGFVHVVGERIVSGINEKTYRATARQFRVDRALLGAAASEPQIADAQASLLESVAEDLRMRAHSGNPMVEADDESVLVSRIFLKLSASRYAELRAKLVELALSGNEPDEDGLEGQLSIALFTSARESR